MNPTTYDFKDLITLQDIVQRTTDECLSMYFTRSTADYKSDGSIVTEADLVMQQALTRELGERYPRVRMLGEETSPDLQRSIAGGEEDYWCLDPVDGTTNFHATVPLFSVSLGLISRGEIVLALVYDPNRREFFGALKNQGIWINGERVERPLQPERLRDCIAFVDFKRLPVAVSTSLVRDTPYKSQRNIGTCALEWAWLAAGRVNLVLHGREKLWDYAAGVLLTEEAGGRCETFDGEPVFDRSLKPRSVIAASNPELFTRWAGRIRSID